MNHYGSRCLSPSHNIAGRKAGRIIFTRKSCLHFAVTPCSTTDSVSPGRSTCQPIPGSHGQKRRQSHTSSRTGADCILKSPRLAGNIGAGGTASWCVFCIAVAGAKYPCASGTSPSSKISLPWPLVLVAERGKSSRAGILTCVDAVLRPLHGWYPIIRPSHPHAANCQ